MPPKLKEWLTEPEHTSKFHAFATMAWFAIGTPVTLFWLTESVAWVSWMSLYAIVVSHWAAYQGGHAEKRVKDDSDNI